MNAVEVCNTVANYLTDLRNKFGDNIDYIKAYDGKITVYFKKEYVEEKITEELTRDLVKRLINTVIGDDYEK